MNAGNQPFTNGLKTSEDCDEYKNKINQIVNIIIYIGNSHSFESVYLLNVDDEEQNELGYSCITSYYTNCVEIFSPSTGTSEPSCTENDLGACDETTCKEIGKYWDNNTCNNEQKNVSSNQNDCTVTLSEIPSEVVAGNSFNAIASVEGGIANKYEQNIRGNAYNGNSTTTTTTNEVNISTLNQIGSIEVSVEATLNDGITKCPRISHTVNVVQSNTGTTGGSSDNACTGGSELIDNYCCEKGVHYYYMGKEKDCQDARDYKSQKKALNG